MNIIMSYFCFLSVQTVNFCGHIARYAPLSANILPRNKFKNLTVGIIRTHLKRVIPENTK